MGMIDRIRARRAKGKGFIAWLIDKAGWRKVAAEALEVGADVRRARRGDDDRTAAAMDAASEYVGRVGNGTE